MIKGSFNLKDRRISHCKSAPCLVSCLRVFCRWFFWYNVFNLSRDLSWPLHCGVMPIYRCEHLVVYHQPNKSCDHKHCDIASIIFSICHVIFRENMLKGYVNLWWIPLAENYRLVMFGGHWPSASGDIKYFICQVTSQKHVIEKSSHFMSGSSSWYVTTLARLVAIGIAVSDI